MTFLLYLVLLALCNVAFATCSSSSSSSSNSFLSSSTTKSSSSAAFLHVSPTTSSHLHHQQHHTDYQTIKKSCKINPSFSKKLSNKRMKMATSSQQNKRERAKINGRIPILSRTVPLGVSKTIKNNKEEDVEEELKAIVWEMEDPSDLIEAWWSTPQSLGTSVGFGCGISPSSSPNLSREKMGDPFGVVMWPGSILASQQLWKHKENVKDKVVLILGAGVGVEAQAAAMAGARKVIATDVNKLTLRLLKFGAERMGLDDVIEGRVFDLFSSEPLPKCDIVVAADVLYNEYLATQIGVRCQEVLSLENAPSLVVTDSQRFHGTDFLKSLNEQRQLEKKKKEETPPAMLEWEECVLEQVTSSGVLVKEDQTYDVKTRMISVGWDGCK